MCRKLWMTIVVVVAFGLGICAVFMPDSVQPYLALIMKIFEVAIPVLAVAALLKYVACCSSSSKYSCCQKNGCGDKTQCNN